MDDDDPTEFLDDEFWEGVYRRADKIRQMVDRMLLAELCDIRATPRRERRCRQHPTS